MTKHATTPSVQGKRRRWRWRRWLVGKVIVLLLLLGAGYWYIANPQRAAGLAEGLLEAMTGATAEIEAARFGLDGTIELNNLVLSVPAGKEDKDKERHADFRRLFAADKVEIEHHAWSLLIGRFRPTAIKFAGPVIHKTEDVDTGTINFQLLQRRRDDDQPLAIPSYLPKVELDKGRVQFGAYDGQRVNIIRSDGFTGHVLAVQSSKPTYKFALKLNSDSGELTGEYNPHDRAFRARIDRMDIEGPHGDWLHGKWRQWWLAHKPSGTMRRMEFGYDIETNAFSAVIEIENARLIPPYAPLVTTDIAMTQGSGKFTFTNDNVKIENLTGDIEGMSYQIDGDVNGFDGDAPFHLTVKVGRFTLPEQPRHLWVMPEPVIRLFTELKPAGQFSSVVVLERAVAKGDIAYDGNITLHDVSLTYHHFPYPLKNIHGNIKFDRDKIDIVSMNGKGPTGATAMIRGHIRPGGDDPGADVRITGLNLPLDDVLRRAFVNQGHLRAFDMFFNREQHQALIDQGMIQTSDQHRQIEQQLSKLMVERDKLDDASEQAATIDQRIDQLKDQRDVPVFDLGGQVNFESHAVHQFNKGGNPRVVTYVTRASDENSYVHIIASRWPYPLSLVSGRLTLAPEQNTVEQIIARCLTSDAAQFSADGVVRVKDGQAIPDLQVTASQMPLDEMLHAALGPTPRKWLGELRIGGQIAATGHIFADDRGELDYDLSATLSNGWAQPFGGRFKIDKLNGNVTLGPDRIRFDQLQGARGDSQLTLTGSADWSGDDQHCAVQVQAKGLRFEDPVADLIPAAKRSNHPISVLVDRHHPTGLFDTIVDFQVRPGDPAKYRLAVEPQTIELDLRGQRIALGDMTGRVVLEGQQMTIDELGGSFASGRFLVCGQGMLGPGAALELTLDAEATRFDKVGRAVMPEALTRVLDNLEFETGYELRQARLIYKPDATDEPKYDVKGTVHLKNASCVIGVPVRQLTGALHFDATYTVGREWPDIDLVLEADTLRVFERVISPMSMTISNAAKSDVLSIRDVRGRCYEGLVIGQGLIELGHPGFFRFEGTLVDAQLGPLLKPRENGGQTTGLLSARMGIEGHGDQVSSRRGRGQLVIRDANIYKVPLSMALLQVANLTFPAAQAFDGASAKFLIDGDVVHFDQLQFDAPSVRIAGHGTMQYSSRQLDLEMVTSNPAAWDLGAVSDLIARFKDELMSVRVSGTLEKPDASINSFAGTKRSWMTIFGLGDKPAGDAKQ